MTERLERFTAERSIDGATWMVHAKPSNHRDARSLSTQEQMGI